MILFTEPIPTPSPSLPTSIPTEDRGEGGLILGTLRIWEFGLIVANIGAVVLLVICVGGCMVYFTVGRRRRRRRRRKGLPGDRVHQKFEGTELETVDFGGEVVCMAIIVPSQIYKTAFLLSLSLSLPPPYSFPCSFTASQAPQKSPSAVSSLKSCCTRGHSKWCTMPPSLTPHWD